MPFADAIDLSRHFGRYPPVHASLAIQIGWKPQGEKAGEMTDEDFRRMRGPIMAPSKERNHG